MIAEGDDLAAFRTEVASWLAANCPASMRGPARPGDVAVWGGTRQEFPDPTAHQWLEIMAGRGWTAPTWPVEYGGGGLSPAQAQILAEELRALGARPPIVSMSQGLAMLGPVIMEYGTPDQMGRFLPPIARGEVRWCQGFSEPEAGSDLASVRTRAERRGDAFVVNGQKIWSSYAHLSDWIFCLVRTDPVAAKQAGISLLLVDLSSPGVTVAPITLISGRSDFCEVFFADVVVPADQLVGQPGAGWTIAKRLLGYERSLLGSAGSALAGGASARLPLPELARQALGGGSGPLPDDLLRDRIAGQLMEVRALKALNRRLKDERRHDPAVPSMVKLLSTETFMRRQDLIMDLAGLEGLRWDAEGSGSARDWLRSRANSIEGGTSEIQLNIIAKHALGLSTAQP